MRMKAGIKTRVTSARLHKGTGEQQLGAMLLQGLVVSASHSVLLSSLLHCPLGLFSFRCLDFNQNTRYIDIFIAQAVASALKIHNSSHHHALSHNNFGSMTLLAAAFLSTHQVAQYILCCLTLDRVSQQRAEQHQEHAVAVCAELCHHDRCCEA